LKEISFIGDDAGIEAGDTKKEDRASSIDRRAVDTSFDNDDFFKI
jgi:hypothetical protein